MKQIKILSLLLGLLLVFSVVSFAEEEIVLTVATWGDVALEGVHIPRFEAMYPNVRVEPLITEIEDHHSMLLTRIAAGTELPDVAFIEVPYIGTIAARGGFVDLSQPPYNAGQYEDLVVPFTFAQASTTDGQIVAMPTDIAPATFFYRKDLLEEMGYKAEDLTTIEDWIEVGKEFTADTTGDGNIDRWLLADAAAIYEMYRRSARELYFDVDGNVIVDQAQFVKGMKNAQKVRELGLDGQIGEWSNDWLAALSEGDVLIQPSGAWMMGHLANWIAPETAGKWGATNLPDDMYAFWGGSFAGIPADAENKEMAWEFIKMVSLDPEVQLGSFELDAMFPSLLETYDDALFEEPEPFLGGQKARLMWQDVALRIPQVITNENDRIAENIMGTALSQVLEDGRDVEEALAEAKTLIERRLR